MGSLGAAHLPARAPGEQIESGRRAADGETNFSTRSSPSHSYRGGNERHDASPAGSLNRPVGLRDRRPPPLVSFSNFMPLSCLQLSHWSLAAS